MTSRPKNLSNPFTNEALIASVQNGFSSLWMSHRLERSDKLAVNGMHDGLKSIMGSEFLVDVVEMVAECLQSYPETLGDFCGVLSIEEPAKNALLLFRE